MPFTFQIDWRPVLNAHIRDSKGMIFLRRRQPETHRLLNAYIKECLDKIPVNMPELESKPHLVKAVKKFINEHAEEIDSLALETQCLQDILSDCRRWMMPTTRKFAVQPVQLNPFRKLERLEACQDFKELETALEKTFADCQPWSGMFLQVNGGLSPLNLPALNAALDRANVVAICVITDKDGDSWKVWDEDWIKEQLRGIWMSD